MPRKKKVSASGKEAYVVMERTFSYDDERYSAEDGGSVQTIYTSLEEAEKVAMQLNLERLKDVELRDYCDSPGDMCSSENFEKLGLGTERTSWRERSSLVEKRLVEIIGENCNNDEGFELPSDLSNEQAAEVFTLLDLLQFYFVQTADIVGE